MKRGDRGENGGAAGKFDRSRKLEGGGFAYGRGSFSRYVQPIPNRNRVWWV